MSPRDRTSIDATTRPPSRRGLWALAFVAASLVALVAVPWSFGRQVASTQGLISDVLQPAAQRSSSLTYIQSRQLARMEGFLLTGDRAAFREPYIAAIEEKDSVMQDLQDLSRQLPGDAREEVFPRVSTLFNDWALWDIENQEIFVGERTDEERLQTRRRYDELRRATTELNRAIEGAVAEGRRDVARKRTLQSRITFALAVLALFATLIVGRVGVRYRDLTIERETRRRDAVRARREIDALLEATGDGVLGIDLDGKCTSLNRAGAQLLGYTEREITGRDVHDTLFHSRPNGALSPRGDSAVLRAVAAGEPLDSSDGDVLWRRKRVAFPARWSLRPLVDGIELRGAVLTFTDMTEIHEKEEALRRAIRQREDVVSIVSHDLRNPLGVALAAADLLLDLPLDEEQRTRQAQIISRSGRRMQNLIEDLLDLARIEAGAFVVRPSAEELVPILEEAVDVFGDQAERKGLALRLDSGEGDLRARVDRDRIIQALANLLDNAIRLTPAGGAVVVGARELGDQVAITVADNGPGIAPDLLDCLFDRFAQSDGAGRGGAGLGLAIVAGVAKAHDGSVTVKSALGSGTQFTITLPKRGPPAGEEAVRGV